MIVRIRVVVAVVVVLGLLGACSANAQDSAGETNAASAVSVPESLAFIGDMAVAGSAPVSAPFDSSSGELELTEGAALQVPDGAFATETTVTAQVIELDYAAVLGDAAPWGRAYVVSTVESVDLGAPVWIEIPRPASGLGVVQLIDGEIVPVEVVADGADARVEIPHFSEVVTMVTEAWAVEEAARATTQADYLAAINKLNLDRGTPKESPADFLLLCLATVTGMFGENSFGGTDDEFLLSLAMSSCTNALIQRSAPDGKYVSTACVGDRVSGGLDFQPAVDACAAEQDETDGIDQTDEAPESAEEAEPVEEADPVEEAVNDWTYVGLFDASGFGGGAHETAFVQIEVEGGAIVAVTGGSTDFVKFPELGSDLVRSAFGGVTQSYVMTITVDEPLGVAADVVLPITLTETGESDGDHALQYPVGDLASGTLDIDFMGTSATVTLTADGIGPVEFIAD